MPALLLGIAGGLLVWMHDAERNPSKDYVEGWMRYHQALEYAEEGDWRHVELRLEEARIHADRLPREERRELLDAIEKV